MCLTKITKKGLKMSGYGWKVFELGDFDELINVYFPCHKILINIWMKATRNLISSPSFSYRAGFHIFLEKPSDYEAKDMTGSGVGIRTFIKKVKYKKGRIVGFWSGEQVVVADEMLVLKSK